jgi:ATP-dependent exoDNAse (exonuclease V) beta subunit
LARRDSQAFRVPLGKTPPKECKELIRKRDAWRAEREKLIAAARAGRRLRTASSLAGEGLAEPGLRAAHAGASDASAVGQAVHAVLEQADLAGGSGLPALARDEAERFGVPKQSDLIAQLAGAALRSEIVQRAAKAKTLFREVPFAVKVNSVLLEGVIDLAFDDGGGLVIVDYKTDDVEAGRVDERAEHYRHQVGAYALAAEKVFGRRPAAASLLFLRPGREVSVTIDDELIASVKERL